MKTRFISELFSPCPSCGDRLNPSETDTTVTIALRTARGGSVEFVRPVCNSCAVKSAYGTDVAMDVLRRCAAAILGEAQDDGE